MKNNKNTGGRTMKASIIANIIILGLISLGISQETGTVTDIDGNVYNTVQIGDQWWMAENLKVTHYRNGDPIPNVTDATEWINLKSGACCNYENNEANVAIYGRLYNWYAVNEDRNIAPEGWHTPSHEEWQKLVDYLGGDAIAGGKMKTTGTIEEGTGLWHSPNAGASNESGFSALPGQYRSRSTGAFTPLGFGAFFWSSTAGVDSMALYHYFSSSGSGAYFTMTNYPTGFSVRCIKDDDEIGIESNGETPESFRLYQNYPNPFNSATIISYNIPSDCVVKLTVHNIKGETIATLVNGIKTAGFHSVTWTADNIVSGLYFYQLSARGSLLVKKFIIIR